MNLDLDPLTLRHLVIISERRGESSEATIARLVAYEWTNLWDNAYLQLLQEYHTHPNRPDMSLSEFLSRHPGCIDGKLPTIDDLPLDNPPKVGYNESVK